MNKEFKHEALSLQDEKPLVYTAMSKHLFYFRTQISKFVMENEGVPLNPFMIFDYFLSDTVDRNLVREGNNNLVRRSDQIWVFGKISDGVLAEIKQAQEQGKKIRYFEVQESERIVEIEKMAVHFEEEVKSFSDQL